MSNAVEAREILRRQHARLTSKYALPLPPLRTAVAADSASPSSTLPRLLAGRAVTTAASDRHSESGEMRPPTASPAQLR